jgi:murein DD-endopeptidase MepM/ murein hydrolase activator NlpD
MKTVLCMLIAMSTCLGISINAGANVFRYESDEGTVCYTDAPTNKKAVLIQRDHHQDVTQRCNKHFALRLTEGGKAKRGRKVSSSVPSLLPPVNGIITSSVGLRLDPIDGIPKNHNGVDIAVPEGTPVKPVESGIVSYSGWRSGYGNIVILDHADGMTTIYAHNFRNLVSQGMNVEIGTTIALSGSTGRSTGPHLHFEAWQWGQNITNSIMSLPSKSMAAGSHPPRFATLKKREIMRKVVMDDGTILLTNLPLFHP